MSYRSNINDELVKITNIELKDDESIISRIKGNIDNPIYACNPNIENKIIYGRIKEIIFDLILKVNKFDVVRKSGDVFIGVELKGGIKAYFTNSRGFYLIISKYDFNKFLDEITGE